MLTGICAILPSDTFMKCNPCSRTLRDNTLSKFIGEKSGLRRTFEWMLDAKFWPVIDFVYYCESYINIIQICAIFPIKKKTSDLQYKYFLSKLTYYSLDNLLVCSYRVASKKLRYLNLEYSVFYKGTIVRAYLSYVEMSKSWKYHKYMNWNKCQKCKTWLVKYELVEQNQAMNIVLLEACAWVRCLTDAIRKKNLISNDILQIWIENMFSSTDKYLTAISFICYQYNICGMKHKQETS